MSDPVQSEPASKDELASAKNKILIGVGLVVVISLLISVLFPRQENGVVAPQFASSKAAEIPDVVVRAWYPSNRVVQDHGFTLEFELENRSDDEVRDIAIELPTGTAFTLLSWSKWDGKRFQQVDTTKGPWINALGKRSSARFQCKLRPAIGSGSYALMAVYAFSTPQGVRTHSAVTVGPFQVTTAWRDNLRNFAAAIQTVLTTLILPISLGALAWYLPHLASSREARERKTDEQRAKNERELAETRAQAQQTWNLLLPYSLQASQKYYLPACSAIGGLSYLYPQWENSKIDERRHEVMHALMMFLRHIRAARDELGGLHFKDRKGEEAAARCWKMLHELLLSRFTLRTREAVLDVLEPRESFARFCRRFEDYRTRGAFIAADEILKTWLEADPPPGTERFGNYLPLFQLFRAILRYEVNRPLERWYGALDDSSELEECVEGLEGLKFPEIPNWEQNRTTIKNYVRVCKVKKIRRVVRIFRTLPNGSRFQDTPPFRFYHSRRACQAQAARVAR
jgi:hypothetical protein